jgi:hypothetical protein
MTKDEALRLALEALEICEQDGYIPVRLTRDAITAIKAALEAKDETVQWKMGASGIGGTGVIVQPQRKPLTDEQIEKLWESTASYYNVCDFARAIEAAHGIKGEA